MGEKIWKTPVPVAFHRNYFDVDSCLIFTEVIDTAKAHPYVLGARITVIDGKIAVISAMVSDTDDWGFNAKNYLKYSSQESWDTIPTGKRNDRKTIKAAGDAYLDDFLDSTKVVVPWGNPCARLEGGVYTQPSCNVGVPQKLLMLGRSYVIDVDLGTVDIFVHFAGDSTVAGYGGIPDSHMFRVENGKLRFVHTISITGKN